MTARRPDPSEQRAVPGTDGPVGEVDGLPQPPEWPRWLDWCEEHPTAAIVGCGVLLGAVGGLVVSWVTG